MTEREKQIKAMVDRFLCWELPESVRPDPCVSPVKEYRAKFPTSPPVGTNLLTADEAQKMFEHCVPDVGFDCLRELAEAAQDIWNGGLAFDAKPGKSDMDRFENALHNWMKFKKEQVKENESSQSSKPEGTPS